MITLINEYLKANFGLKIPSVFFYYSTRMILAAITSLAVVIFLGPRFINLLKAFQRAQILRTEDCPEICQHKKKQGTPSMGGILILGAMLVSLFLWMDLRHIFTAILLFSTISFGLLGFGDDYVKFKSGSSKNGMSGKVKLLLQTLLASMLAIYLLCPSCYESLGIGNWFNPPTIKELWDQPVTLTLQQYAGRFYLPFIKDPVLELTGMWLILAALLIMFVVIGSSNAVNLTDGLDGLATGCLIMVASCLALFAFVSNNVDLASYLNILYVEGSGEIAIYLSAFVGACIGFLWYNGHPAELFMGDTGSLALGGIIGVSAVLLNREGLLALIGGVFVAETLSVILQVASFRWRNKKRIFLCTPLHHHFECKGWPETKIVIRFWIIGLLLAIVGIASLKFQ
ncbi:MAG: phospho-N-acetylmuramoyl-pentapeptide-transferase [Parachlamydiaceae bacterium]|nr:phospho-N-acetylmuramoyl-pentapeptide-transferase [Parachlamydiaceae bacterium]